MKIGKFEFIIRKIKKIYGVNFPSKNSLCNWIKKNIDPSKTTKLIIDAEKQEIEITEI
jgi:hypothetical protein